MNLVEIGTRVLTSCMDVKAGETVLVVTDDEKFQIGQALYQAAKELGADAMLVTMSPREVSGQEPPASIAAAMKAADVVLCPMSTSITHTRANRHHAQHHGGYVPSGRYDRGLRYRDGADQPGD